MPTTREFDMRTHTEVLRCPTCGTRRSAEVVTTVTPTEAAVMSSGDFRKLGTVRCSSCGYWFFSPPAVSCDAGESK